MTGRKRLLPLLSNGKKLITFDVPTNTHCQGLSLQELSEQTGISRASLGNYETDDYKEISHKAILTLADFYGVTSDYLLGLTENRQESAFKIKAFQMKIIT